MASGEKKEMKQFVTFEGIDGSGKSTVATKVLVRLQKQGYDAVLTVEPTDSPVGKFVKQCISTHADPFVTTFSFIADRILHCKQIEQWLDEKKIVLCDRYADSTYAYQSVQLEPLMKQPLHWLQELSKNRILIPDRTFFFNIEPKQALKRIQNRSDLIAFEQTEFLTKVHENYCRLATEPRFLHLQASKPINDLVIQCVQDILE